jgi:isopentenyldiphosphate isomerase
MTIQKLKKELGLTNTEIAEFFGLSAGAYANSSAKKRYEDALCNFYVFVKSKAGGQNIKTD